MPENTVMFVCTGNQCRSPIAEHLLRHRAGPDADWNVISSGTATGVGLPASAPGVAVMKELGIDMTEHRSQGLTPELMDRSTVIIAMAAIHRDEILRLNAASQEKIYLFRSFAKSNKDADIADPLGLPEDMYREVREEINAILPELILFLRELE